MIKTLTIFFNWLSTKSTPFLHHFDFSKLLLPLYQDNRFKLLIEKALYKIALFFCVNLGNIFGSDRQKQRLGGSGFAKQTDGYCEDPALDIFRTISPTCLERSRKKASSFKNVTFYCFYKEFYKESPFTTYKQRFTEKSGTFLSPF